MVGRERRDDGRRRGMGDGGCLVWMDVALRRTLQRSIGNCLLILPMV